MSETLYSQSLNIDTLSTGNIAVQTDILKQWPYLSPNVATANTILAGLTRLVNTYQNTQRDGVFWLNTATYGTISGVDSGTAYFGACLIPDGRIIYCPYNATNVGIFNPTTLTFTTAASTGTLGVSIPAGSGAYTGSVLLPDGRVCFVPCNATNVGIFNPFTNSFSTVAGVGTAGVNIPGGTAAFVGGGILPDKRVVFVSYNATHVGVFNPTTNSFTTYASGQSGLTGTSAYAYGQLLPDGRYLFCLWQASTGTLGIFNYATNTFSSITGLPTTGSPFRQCVLVPDGRVILVPQGTVTYVGVFDSTTSTYTTVASGQVPSNAAYQGGCLLPDGRVLFGGGNSTNIGVFDPMTNNFSTILSGTLPGVSTYNGMIVIPDGRVILVTNGGTVVGILAGLSPGVSAEFCLNPLFNKI